MSFDPVDPIGSVFADIIGKPCWQAERGHGSFLTFEFGEPHLEVRGSAPDSTSANLRRRNISVRGDWHLWIYCCDWQGFDGQTQIAHSESEDAQIDKLARLLNAQKLVSLNVDPATGGSVFTFELGTILKTSAWDDPTTENWFLYAPDGHVLSYRADGKFSWQRGDTNPDETVWDDIPPQLGAKTRSR